MGDVSFIDFVNVARCLQKQLSSVNGAFKTLKELLDPPNADNPAEVSKEALEAIVEEFRTQRYDGHTWQLTLLVKNLSSFFDVVSNIVRMIQDFEENRLLPPEAYLQSATYAGLAGLLEDTFLNYMSAWGHTLQLFSIYFDRDFKWDARSSQFKEWCARSQGFIARSRGITLPTISILESQLQASIDVARNLIHCKKVRASGSTDSTEDWPSTYQELPRMWMRCLSFLEMTLKDLLSHQDHSGDLDSIRSGVDHELSERTERQVRDVFYLDSARAGAAEPEMPTLDELTNDLIQQRTLPTGEQKVAPARSTLGTICKHVVYPRAQDRSRLRPVPVAIKWIEVYAGTTGSVAMPNGVSSKQRWRALCAEWGALLTVRNSLLRSTESDSDVSPQTPTNVNLEEVNVVIGLALHGNGLSHNDVRALMARTAPPLEEVRVRKRVGIVFEWLPNGSLEDILAYFRPSTRTSGRNSRNHLTPKLALDCQAARWASSSSSNANSHIKGAALAVERRPLPDDLANCQISSIMTMPVDSEAIAALGMDWIRAVIPPPSGEHCLPRWSLKDIPSALSLFSSRLGVFKSVVTFPACKEPLNDLEDPDTVYRIPTLFVFSFGWTLQLMLQFAKGVALCHRVGVVHRDLEPWNIMFDRFGRLKLIDFGFAQQMLDPARGSVGRLDHELYAAPECRVAVSDEPIPMHEVPSTDDVVPAHVTLDLPRTMDSHKATDVWTMGVVFWQMITLQPATGILLQAVARIAALRRRLAKDVLIQDDVEDAVRKLVDLGLPEGRARQEAERVPPLPAARFVRPAIFPPSRRADKDEWYSDKPGGGYRRLRTLIVEMLSVDASDRPTALLVAEALNRLIADYQCML